MKGGGGGGAVHGQPMDECGTVKNSPDVLVGPNVSTRICLNWMALIVHGKQIVNAYNLMC